MTNKFITCWHFDLFNNKKHKTSAVALIVSLVFHFLILSKLTLRIANLDEQKKTIEVHLLRQKPEINAIPKTLNKAVVITATTLDAAVKPKGKNQLSAPSTVNPNSLAIHEQKSRLDSLAVNTPTNNNETSIFSTQSTGMSKSEMKIVQDHPTSKPYQHVETVFEMLGADSNVIGSMSNSV